MKNKLRDLLDAIGVAPLQCNHDEDEYSMENILRTIVYNFNHGWDCEKDEDNLSPEQIEFILAFKKALD